MFGLAVHWWTAAQANFCCNICFDFVRNPKKAGVMDSVSLTFAQDDRLPKALGPWRDPLFWNCLGHTMAGSNHQGQCVERASSTNPFNASSFLSKRGQEKGLIFGTWQISKNNTCARKNIQSSWFWLLCKVMLAFGIYHRAETCKLDWNLY